MFRRAARYQLRKGFVLRYQAVKGTHLGLAKAICREQYYDEECELPGYLKVNELLMPLSGRPLGCGRTRSKVIFIVLRGVTSLSTLM